MKNPISPEKLIQIKDTFNTSVRILKLVWKVDKWLFLGALVATLLPGILPFVDAYIFKLIIDYVIAVLSGQNLEYNLLFLYIGLKILSSYIMEVSFSSGDFINRLLWAKVPIELNQLYFGKLSSLEIQYFEDDKFRDLMEKVRQSHMFRPQQLIQNLFYAIQSFVQVVIAFIAIVQLNWIFLILILLVAIPEFINQSYFSKLSWAVWDKNSPLSKRFGYLSRLLEGHREAKEIRLFTLAKHLLKEFKELDTKFYKDNISVAKKGYFINTVFEIFSTLVIVGIEMYIIFEALFRRITVGDIAFYHQIIRSFRNGLSGLLRNISVIFESSLYVKTLFDLIDSKPIISKSENPITLQLKKAPVIEFRNVSFAYPGSEVKVLNNFNLVINPGEKVAFVGENGVGKSTIIKLLVRFYDVDDGEILVNGHNLKDLDLESWYKNVGVLFQDFNRYEHTVKENIYFGKVHEDLDLEEIVNSSKLSGSHQFISNYKKGYEQILGKIFEEGVEPSGGQWQKIALARAFFRNAPVLVLDEPTASIDAKAESEIFEKVEKLSRDKTVIIISHRFSTVRNADKIYVIDDGKIIEEGDHKSLMKKDGMYASLFNMQAKGYQ